MGDCIKSWKSQESEIEKKKKSIMIAENDLVMLYLKNIEFIYSRPEKLYNLLDRFRPYGGDDKECIIVIRLVREYRNIKVIQYLKKRFQKYKSKIHYEFDIVSFYIDSVVHFTPNEIKLLEKFKLEIHYEDIGA